MANVDLEKGERILGQGECMQMRGPLSVPGVLSLTDRRLVFVPDKLNKLIGMKQVTIRLESIKSYSLVGVDRALHVQGADDHWKFHGKWARTVHRRLKAFLEAGQEDQSSGEFGARERILLQAPADYFAKAVVTVGGDVIVTTRYLRFTPSAIERLMWRNLEIEVPIQDISNVQMNGPRRLTVTFGKTEHRFAGALVPRMYAALSAARNHSRSERDEASLLFELWPAQIHGTLLAHAGFLLLTLQGLRFMAKGTLGIRDGADDVLDLPFSSITRLDMSSKGRLVVGTSTGRQIFTFERLSERFEEIITHYAAHSLRGTPFWTDRSEATAEHAEAAASILAPWAARMPESRDQQPHLFGPALRVSSRVGSRPGWVAIFQDFVAWFPAGGLESGIYPLRLTLSQFERGDQTNAASPELLLKTETMKLRLVPAHQEALTLPFWGTVGTLTAELLLQRQETTDWEPEPASPTDVWNRRQTYRVTFLERTRREVRLRPVESEDEALIGVLTDFSLDGCGVSASKGFDIDTEVEIDIPDQDRIVTLLGKLIHRRKVKKRNRWLFGISFSEDTKLDDDTVRNLWLEFQREEAHILRGIEDDTVVRTLVEIEQSEE